jgi:3-phosphoshikimate 1-carboxyvinyltransferase
MRPLRSRPAGPLTGTCTVPGDKSISHRALMLAASAVGESRITGLLEADDVLATAAALRLLGADIGRDTDGHWRVWGCGTGGLREPEAVLDLRNSGTGVRLLIGLVASQPIFCVFTGDASLNRRPMRRIMAPLAGIGARFRSRSGDRLPLAVEGAALPLPIAYTLPVASAQVKSAILLAGLNAPGTTTVIEPLPSRDHTERLLQYFGAAVETEILDGGGRHITVSGQPELTGRAVTVPGDISSAAFPLVASCIVPGSQVVLRGVGVNPLRTGLIETLREMGAAVRITAVAAAGDEPVADLSVAAAPLRAVDIPPERVPAMIDEFPIVAVAAACAQGTTRMHGLAELRVKESDRLAAIAAGLAAAGVRVEMGGDWLAIEGVPGGPAGGATVQTHYDHRIAMAFLTLGLACRQPMAVDDASAIATSFPGFTELMNGLGADISEMAAPSKDFIFGPSVNS